MSIDLTFPLDSEGFLRRQCPTCEREFKWFSSDSSDEGEAPEPTANYYCPYCGIQADSWWTSDQAAAITTAVTREVIEPALEPVRQAMKDLSRKSGGLLTGRVEVSGDLVESPPVELDDMLRVNFRCHPSEPVKVTSDWIAPVYCLVCGVAFDDYRAGAK